MADALPWPAILVPSSESGWVPRGGTRSGGRNFQGAEQIVASPTAAFRASLTIPCPTPDHVRAMRRVLALGRTVTWLVGPVEVSRAPWPTEPILGGRLTYATAGAPQPALSFELAEDAALNATEVSLSRIAGGALAEGMLLQIGLRLHVAVGLTTPDPVDPATGLAVPGTVGVAIRPWLKAPGAAGDPVELGRPVGLMRLAADDTGDLDLQLSRFGTVKVDLEEP